MPNWLVNVTTEIIKAFIFVLVVAQGSFAFVHRIFHNEATTLPLQSGDEIVLEGMPLGWGFSRIVMGVNSVPAVQLSGTLQVNGCEYELHSFYHQIDFPFTGATTIKYFGPSQKLPIQWWVDSAPIELKCRMESEGVSREDSIQTSLYQFADSIYVRRTADYLDLGKINEEIIWEGSSKKFKINDLPNWFYNRIYVQIEPVDGRELSGYVFSGTSRNKIDGWHATFILQQKNALPPFFEIAFTEYRKVKIKWWAEVGTPSKTEIESLEKTLPNDSVKVSYFFGLNSYTKSSVSLVYSRRMFNDGVLPKINRLSFNPQGPIWTREVCVRGPVYDIEASLKYGDSVVLALPIELAFDSSKHSVIVEHFIEEQNRWIDETVDSIVDNYAYFKVGHFSWFRTGLRYLNKGITYTMVPATAICSALSSSCKEAVDDFVDRTSDIEADVLTHPLNSVGWALDLLESLICFDKNELDDIFGSSKKPTWNPDPGNVNYESIQKNGQDVIGVLKTIRKKDLIKLSDATACIVGEKEENCKWRVTKDNLDVLLADAILALFPLSKDEPDFGVSKYKFSMEREKGFLSYEIDESVVKLEYNDYFKTHSQFVDDAVSSIDGALQCANVLNYDGGKFQSYINLYKSIFSNPNYTKICHAFFDVVIGNDIGYLGSMYDCAKDGFSGLSFLLDNFSGYTDVLQKISEAMVRVSLLAWLKKGDDYRNYTLLTYKTTYDGVLAWLEIVGPFLAENNIVVKTYGSLALYEYIHYGTDGNLKMINGGLNRHYGENGGYSEGMGYSQYIWDDLTYVLSALQDAYKLQDEDSPNINKKFLKSPDYIFDFSRPVGVFVDNIYKPLGLIPVEVDDGVTYNPDYRVWAKLKNDPKYLAMSERYPLREENGKINSLVPFGFPDEKMYNFDDNIVPDRGSLWSGFRDGIGMITAVKDGDTVALSMIAESGKLWTRGQAHDQQDNQSFTLSSSKNGFLIQDRGYSGFDRRSSSDKFHRYNDHNVLTYMEGQDDNKDISFGEIWSRSYDVVGDLPGLTLDFFIGFVDLVNRLGSKDYNFTVEGGQDASVLEPRIEDYENKVVGYTAEMSWAHKKDGTYDAVIENNRTILYFGENFWVIDRPNMAGLTWLANSPLNTRNKIGVNLYSSTQKDAVDLGKGDDDAVRQVAFRADFHYKDDEVMLTNYSYSLSDENAQTYVMTYALGEAIFEKDELNCKENYQCFVSMDKRLRLVVPPRNNKFKICEVIPDDECSGDASSSGITMFKNSENDGKWSSSWVLDGKLTCYDSGREIECKSVEVSKTHYAFARMDGSVVSGKYSSAYLPAVPILLLR